MKRLGTRKLNHHISETIWRDAEFEYEIHSVSSLKYVRVIRLIDRKLVCSLKRGLKRTNRVLWILKANLPLIIKKHDRNDADAFDCYLDLEKACYEVGGAK